jgi:hypothetical protein
MKQSFRVETLQEKWVKLQIRHVLHKDEKYIFFNNKKLFVKDMTTGGIKGRCSYSKPLFFFSSLPSAEFNQSSLM